MSDDKLEIGKVKIPVVLVYILFIMIVGAIVLAITDISFTEIYQFALKVWKDFVPQ